MSEEAKRNRARALLAKDPDWEYGSILPIATTKGKVRPAIPDILRDPMVSWMNIQDSWFDGNVYPDDSYTEKILPDVLNVMPVSGAAGLGSSVARRAAVASEAMPSPWSAEVKSLANSDKFLLRQFGHEGPPTDHPYWHNWAEARMREIRASPDYKMETALENEMLRKLELEEGAVSVAKDLAARGVDQARHETMKAKSPMARLSMIERKLGNKKARPFGFMEGGGRQNADQNWHMAYDQPPAGGGNVVRVFPAPGKKLHEGSSLAAIAASLLEDRR